MIDVSQFAVASKENEMQAVDTATYGLTSQCVCRKFKDDRLFIVRAARDHIGGGGMSPLRLIAFPQECCGSDITAKVMFIFSSSARKQPIPE